MVVVMELFNFAYHAVYLWNWNDIELLCVMNGE